MKKFSIFLLGLYFILMGDAFADDLDFDFDSLFDDFENSIEILDETNQVTASGALSSFLVSDGVRIGGQWYGSAGPSWTWTDPWHDGLDLTDSDSKKLSLDVGALLYFDARPNEDTKFYGSVKTSYPFQQNSIPNIQVFELFGDRAWNDTLFFRFGKHTVKWGVGYFWSPADVINLSAIDVLDPEAQREGPISLRLHIPIHGTQNNIWLYAVAPNKAVGTLVPEDVAYAAKYETIIGGYELGLGAFWQKNLAPKAMLTATGSIKRFNLFGELVLGWGSDKDWVDEINSNLLELASGKSPITTSRKDDRVFASGTAGFMYVDNQNKWNATLQYYFNGDGYTNSKRNELIQQGHDFVDVAQGLPSLGGDLANGMVKLALLNSGQHYAAFMLSKSEAITKDLSLSLLALANMSDLSGFVQPSISYTFFDGFSANLNPSFYWTTSALWGAGNDGEYVVLVGGPAVTLSIKAILGSGRF